MHSNHYKSFTIHYNGDYSGDYLICNISRDEFGHRLVQNTDEYCTLRVSEDELRNLLHQSLVLFDFNIELVGLDDDTKEPVSFNVNTEEVLDFFISKRKNEMISEIEDMKSEEFFEKYMKNKL